MNNVWVRRLAACAILPATMAADVGTRARWAAREIWLDWRAEFAAARLWCRR